ncbi:MAG: glycosyltransferase family 4 protein [Bacillota bacterium]
MRIALIAPEKLPVPPISGGPVEITIYELARRLQDRHQVTVFCPSDPSLPEHESLMNMRYLRLPHPSTDQYLEALMQQFTTETFELVHIFDRPQFVLSLAPRLVDTKFILHLHSDLPFKESSGAEAVACLDQVSAVVVTSHFLRIHVATRFPRLYDKSRVIKPGVDLTRFAPVWGAMEERTRKRQQLHLADKQIIMCASSLASVEGIHILLQALRPLMRQDQARLLMLVGDSWYSDPSATPYSRDLAQYGQGFKKQIFFTGSLKVSEMPMVYQLADLYVCPAQWEEHQGMVNLEVMATGLPVIASARGAIPEMVRHGQTGILVYKHTEPAGFTKAIEFLLANPKLAADLGRQGRGLVEREYQWEQAVEELEQLQDEVMAEKPFAV